MHKPTGYLSASNEDSHLIRPDSDEARKYGMEQARKAMQKALEHLPCRPHEMNHATELRLDRNQLYWHAVHIYNRGLYWHLLEARWRRGGNRVKDVPTASGPVE